MSSHHIVREKQEPALLILSLKSFSEELLGQLLEWSPTVIVTADTYHQVNDLGIKIDALVDLDMANHLQTHIKFIPTGEDEAVEAALKYLVGHNYHAVNIITDDLFIKNYMLFADKIDLVIYQGNRKIYAINSNFSKWMPAGELIELIGQPIHLQVNGLHEIEELKYETTHDGFFSIHFQQPTLFLAEHI